jgi:hypothetical protein
MTDQFVDIDPAVSNVDLRHLRVLASLQAYPHYASETGCRAELSDIPSVSAGTTSQAVGRLTAGTSGTRPGEASYISAREALGAH